MTAHADVQARLKAIIEPLREERARVTEQRKALKADYERQQREAAKAYNEERRALEQVISQINQVLKPLEGAPQTHRMTGRPRHASKTMPKFSKERLDAGRTFVLEFLTEHEIVTVADVREHFSHWGKGAAEALMRVLYEEEHVVRLSGIGHRGKKLYKLSGDGRNEVRLVA